MPITKRMLSLSARHFCMGAFAMLAALTGCLAFVTPVASADLSVTPPTASAVQRYTAPDDVTTVPVTRDDFDITWQPPVALKYEAIAYAHSLVWDSTTLVMKTRPNAHGRMVSMAVPHTVKNWTCLDRLWTRESSWQINAVNPKTRAYGIPQSLPAKKLASEGADWRYSYRTQIDWGLRYIAQRYGTTCQAWKHEQKFNWY